MINQVKLLALAVAVFGAAVYGLFQLIQNGLSLSSIIQTMILCLPVVGVVFLSSASIWPGLAIGGLAFTFAAPLPILQRLEICMVIAMMLTAGVVARGILSPDPTSIFRAFEAKMMLVVALILTVRLIYDRPGSANLGSGGGSGEAFRFILGPISFFSVAKIFSGEWDRRLNMRVILVLTAIGAMANVVLCLIEDPRFGILALFGRQMWLLCAFVLASIFAQYQAGAGVWLAMKTVAVTGGTLLMAAVSPHRSRPLFAVAMILVAALAHGLFRRTLLSLVAAICLLMMVMASIGYRVPYLSSRALSTLLPVPERQFDQFVWEYHLSGEKGWESNFRELLFDLAWVHIKNHPLTGRGFVLDRDEVIWAMGRSGAIEDAVQGLAVSGCYHNSLLELAVFCGLPVAGIFVLVYVAILIRFVRLFPCIRDASLKWMATGVLCYFAAASGQMLMNGGAQDFFYICVLLGAMHGMACSIRRQSRMLQRLAEPLPLGADLSGPLVGA